MEVTIVFCEGPHDIHFAARSLSRHAGYNRFTGKASELPTPFGWRSADLLDQRVGLVLAQLRRLDSLTLDLDHLNFGTKPLFELALRSDDGLRWVLFVNMGGDAASKEVRKLIGLVRTAMKATRNAEVKSVAFAFLFDADFKVDGKGVQWRTQRFREEYHDAFPKLPEINHSQWVGAEGQEVGLWIHSKDDEGTMEDHAARLANEDPSWASRLAEASKFVDAHLPATHALRTKRDKGWKAKLTIAGQVQERVAGTGNKHIAGSGFSVVIEAGLADTLFDLDVCRDLAAFLQGPRPAVSTEASILPELC